MTLTLTFQIIEPVPYNVAIFLPAIVLGIAGGILGAIFTRLNTAVNLARRKVLECIKNQNAKHIIRIVEAVLLVVSPFSWKEFNKLNVFKFGLENHTIFELFNT